MGDVNESELPASTLPDCCRGTFDVHYLALADSDPERPVEAGPKLDTGVKVKVRMPDWQRTRYPKLRFLKEFFQHLALIALVDLSVRVFLLAVSFVHAHIPVEGLPKELEPYVSVSVPRAVVTVMDCVAVLLSVILGIVTVVRMFREYWRDLE